MCKLVLGLVMLVQYHTRVTPTAPNDPVCNKKQHIFTENESSFKIEADLKQYTHLSIKEVLIGANTIQSKLFYQPTSKIKNGGQPTPTHVLLKTSSVLTVQNQKVQCACAV